VPTRAARVILGEGVPVREANGHRSRRIPKSFPEFTATRWRTQQISQPSDPPGQKKIHDGSQLIGPAAPSDTVKPSQGTITSENRRVRLGRRVPGSTWPNVIQFGEVSRFRHVRDVAKRHKNQAISNYRRNLLGLTGVPTIDSNMGYQALLFCPDEKTARTLTQVLSELEFSVEPCTETFAAVKKLMGEHFDAVVVDCDNEQNATLLFKSARNSTSNQASLAVAVVEGQVGVAKAFRIGANLVLTKPINVEQAKGTLRVARGLLRKGEAGKPAAPIATTPTPPTPRPATPAPKPAAIPAQAPVAARPSFAPAASAVSLSNAPVPVPPVAKKVAASAPAAANLPSAPTPVFSAPAAPAISAELKPISKPAAAAFPAPSTPPALWAGSGAASAPAPAREAQPASAAETTVSSGTAESEIAASTASSGTLEATSSTSEAPAPSFTFGGANAPEESGGSKKILLGLVAVVLIGAVLYVGRSYLGGQSSAPLNPPAASAAPASAQPAPAASAPAPTKPSAQTISPTTTSSTAPPTTQSAAPAGIELVSSDNPHGSPNSAKESAPAPKSASAAVEPGEAPRLVKGGAVPKIKAQPATPDAPAPSVIGMDPSASTGLPNLGAPTISPKPVLQRLNISQGVSLGLLVKKVDPVYPPNAVHMQIEGAVQLLATISKSGDITEVKVLSGDKQLTRAASDAVKRWKYKPYLLNGEPVDIQTQITVNFRLPH